jgi:hypothetical protein
VAVTVVGAVAVQKNARTPLRDNASPKVLTSNIHDQEKPSTETALRTLLRKMTEITNEEIQERFGPAAGAELEADVLTELRSIMQLHSIDVQELWYKWESYSMKMGSDDMKLNIETATALKKDVQDGLERESRKAHLHTNKRGGATPRSAPNNSDVFGMWGSSIHLTYLHLLICNQVGWSRTRNT